MKRLKVGIAAHGCHVETEIIGAEGSIRISGVPRKNLAERYINGGVCTECVQSFPERFEEAYLAEMNEFVDCVLTGREPGVTVQNGIRSTAVGYATTAAWHSGKVEKIGDYV